MKTKNFVLIILLSFVNFIYSQVNERPDNWFLGLNYDMAISGLELKPNKKSYSYDLELWFRTLYEEETFNRESWLSSGKNYPEPEEKILMPDDITFRSNKFYRIFEKTKSNQLAKEKFILQSLLLNEFNWDQKTIEFDQDGIFSHVTFFKYLGERIKSDEEILKFSMILKSLNNIYGENKKDKTKNIKYYWTDVHSEIDLISDLDNKFIGIIYKVE